MILMPKSLLKIYYELGKSTEKIEQRQINYENHGTDGCLIANCFIDFHKTLDFVDQFAHINNFQNRFNKIYGGVNVEILFSEIQCRTK